MVKEGVESAVAKNKNAVHETLYDQIIKKIPFKDDLLDKANNTPNSNRKVIQKYCDNFVGNNDAKETLLNFIKQILEAFRIDTTAKKQQGIEADKKPSFAIETQQDILVDKVSEVASTKFADKLKAERAAQTNSPGRG